MRAGPDRVTGRSKPQTACRRRAILPRNSGYNTHPLPENRSQTVHAPVAQLDRASGFEPEGREFESLRARQKPPGRIVRCGLCVWRQCGEIQSSRPSGVRQIRRERIWTAPCGPTRRRPGVSRCLSASALNVQSLRRTPERLRSGRTGIGAISPGAPHEMRQGPSWALCHQPGARTGMTSRENSSSECRASSSCIAPNTICPSTKLALAASV
jgi:hypothetical protein